MERLAFAVVAALGMLACGDDDGPLVKKDCPAGDESEACQVFHIVNEERQARGLEPYDWDPALGLAAQLHCEDMAANDYFSHEGADGSSFSERARDAGYDGSPRGENIAGGQNSAEGAMDQWMGSDGHRNNILSDGSDEMGVGFCDDNLWVQVFGRAPAE
jgi:uncharacterized protein YkwD